MIRYFVSYAHNGGFGACEIKLRYPVRSMKDIDVLANVVKQAVPGLDDVVILNFQRFEPAAPSADQPVSATSTPGEPS